MITSSDKEYCDTKMVKQGKRTLPQEFQLLADWISETHNVKVLNIVKDVLRPSNQNRIQIILEKENDYLKFKENPWGNYIKSKQQSIKHKYEEITGNRDLNSFLVVFSAFEPIAIEEANSKIPESRIDDLKIKLDNSELWLIRRKFRSVVFFFYTPDQIEKYRSNGFCNLCSMKYLKILKEYDEFNYINEMNFRPYFDSKENFDKNYRGSWFNYYR